MSFHLLKMTNTEQKILDFGNQRGELIPVLEIIAGGLGPYEDPRVIFDAVSTVQRLPRTYTDADIDRVRSLLKELHASENQVTSQVLTDRIRDLQFAVWNRYNPLLQIGALQQTALEIQDPITKQTRVDEARSLELFARVYGAKLGVSGIVAPSYQECVLGVPGLSIDPTPSIKEMDALRADIMDQLMDLGYTRGSFAQRVAKMRTKMETVEGKEAYFARYQEIGEALIAHIKQIDPSFPREANVEFVDSSKASLGTGGSFDYGRGNSAFQAQSFIVAHEQGTIADLLITTAHEIGGHFRLTVLWNQYANETNDTMGDIGTMETNQCCTQEGMADQGISFYRGFAARYVDPTLVDVELSLYLLNRALLGHQVAAHFSEKPQTNEEIIEQGIQYGMLPEAIANRASGIVSGRRNEFLKLYGGPAYHPGLQRVSRLASQYGGDAIWQAVREPISLTALEAKMRG